MRLRTWMATGVFVLAAGSAGATMPSPALRANVGPSAAQKQIAQNLSVRATAVRQNEIVRQRLDLDRARADEQGSATPAQQGTPAQP